jgi:hypothetical protein
VVDRVTRQGVLLDQAVMLSEDAATPIDGQYLLGAGASMQLVPDEPRAAGGVKA